MRYTKKRQIPNLFSAWSAYAYHLGGSLNTASVNNQIEQAMTLQPYPEKLDCKVPALNGSKDGQVIAAANLKGPDYL